MSSRGGSAGTPWRSRSVRCRAPSDCFVATASRNDLALVVAVFDERQLRRCHGNLAPAAHGIERIAGFEHARVDVAHRDRRVEGRAEAAARDDAAFRAATRDELRAFANGHPPLRPYA